MPPEVLQTLLNLADTMELAHRPLPIPVRGPSIGLLSMFLPGYLYSTTRSHVDRRCST